MSETSSVNTVITLQRRKCLAQASAGVITLPVLKGMAFGTGGVDSNGNVIEPSPEQTGLVEEIYRKEFDGFSFPEDTTCEYKCTLTDTECNGYEISELGLYDENGDIVGIKTFTKKGKDADIAQTYTVDDVF